MYWTIDRFEEDVAVLMDDDGVCRNVPRAALPAQAKDGDVLTATADGYRVEAEETRVRRERNERLQRLLRRQ